MPKTITKTSVNFWLDFLLLCLFLVLCWSSITLRYVFPPVDKITGWTLWGLNYEAWTDIQFFVLCAMAFAILLHVMLHWSWVCGVVSNWYRKRKGIDASVSRENSSRTLWGVGMLIVICNLIGLGLAVAVLTIKGPPLP